MDCFVTFAIYIYIYYIYIYIYIYVREIVKKTALNIDTVIKDNTTLGAVVILPFNPIPN